MEEKAFTTLAGLFEPRRTPPPADEGRLAYPLEDRTAKGFDLSQVREEPVEIGPDSRSVMITDPRSPGADRMRLLRMRLREIRKAGKLKTLVITSAIPEDGKSTVASNLATVLAEGGRQKVLLIEADLYQPVFAKNMGIPARPGLAECLESGSDPLVALQRLKPLEWFLLQAGATTANPTELIQSGAFAKLIDAVSPLFDWVLIDTPPVGVLTDALAISRFVDGTLFVVRADRTPREAVAEAVAQLGSRRVTAIILNGSHSLNGKYEKYASYYGVK